MLSIDLRGTQWIRGQALSVELLKELQEKMKRLKLIYSSVVGKKFIAAITGTILFLFLVGHVAGNLKVFTPDEAGGVPAIDAYAQFLRTMGHPLLPNGLGLWMSRVVLLGAIILHMIVVVQLAMINRNARPKGYAQTKYRAASASARWMLVSGGLLLAFVVFHILHFTTGTIQLGEFEHGLVYSNLFHSFTCWPVVIIYLLAMLVVGFHLYHGIWSLFQTIGLDNPDRNSLLRSLALAITLALVVGFSSLPLAFMAGAMDEPPEYSHELLDVEEH